MRLFWMAWGFALLLLAMAVSGGAWLIEAGADWSLPHRLAGRALAATLLVFAFVGAYRLATLGTLALKHVLAQNLAIVIAMELDDLRRAAREQAALRSAATAVIDGCAQITPSGLQIPHFFGERAELRVLLGLATERTLEELLVALRSFNAAARAAADNATYRALRGELDVVLEQLDRSMRSLAPFNQRFGANLA